MSQTYFLRPHDVSRPDSFVDGGTYRRRENGYRLRFTARVQGTRIAGPGTERWRGRFRAKVLVTRRGQYVDTCRLRGLRWRARLAG